MPTIEWLLFQVPLGLMIVQATALCFLSLSEDKYGINLKRRCHFSSYLCQQCLIISRSRNLITFLKSVYVSVLFYCINLLQVQLVVCCWIIHLWQGQKAVQLFYCGPYMSKVLGLFTRFMNGIHVDYLLQCYMLLIHPSCFSVNIIVN